MENDKRMMSIGEVAISIGVTRRIVLNYEDKDLITPDIKMGEYGNRYYSPDTLTRIRSVRRLQNLGLSLDEIRDYFDGITDIVPLIHKLEMRRDEINLCIEQLKERVNDSSNQITKVILPAQKVYACTYHDKTIGERMERLRQIMPEIMRKYGTDTGKRMYFIEYPIQCPDDITYLFTVPENSEGEHIRILPESEALCIYFHGGYDKIPIIREKLMTYAKKEGVTISGTCRHIYLEGPPQHKEESRYITQVVLPISTNHGKVVI